MEKYRQRLAGSTFAQVLKPALAQIEKSVTTPEEKRRGRVLALLAQGKTVTEVSKATGFSGRWVRELAHRYQESGVNALSDHRKQNPGASTLLTRAEQAELQVLLQKPPAEGGRWTGQKIANWIEAKKGRKVGRQRGCEYLQRLT